MFLSLAWRNIWRKKTRTFTLFITIMVGIWSVIISMGFINGFGKVFIDNSINSQYSHIQIHNKSFLQEKDVNLYIPQAKINEIVSLDNNNVKSISSRTVIDGMASTAYSSRGITILGITPDIEAEISGIDLNIREGVYFQSESRNSAIIGEKLAQKLQVDLNSKIVLVFQNINGEFTGGAFDVIGIFKSASQKIDEGFVYIQQKELNALLETDNVIHEIAILLNDREKVDEITKLFSKEFPDLSVKSWKQLAPELQLMDQTTEMNKMIVLTIIIMAFAFGLINTILMSVLERTCEFGMLIANGLIKIKIIFLMVLENSLILLTSGVLGVILAKLTITIMSNTGVDFSIFAKGLESMGYSKIIYPFVALNDIMIVSVAIFITGLLATVYPALMIKKLNPVEAMRKSS